MGVVSGGGVLVGFTLSVGLDAVPLGVLVVLSGAGLGLDSRQELVGIE
jgi:hypothetical protein